MDSISATKCNTATLRWFFQQDFDGPLPFQIARYALVICMIHSGALVYWDVEDYIKEANKQLDGSKNYKTLF